MSVLRCLRDLGVAVLQLTRIGLYMGWLVLNGWEQDWKAAR